MINAEMLKEIKSMADDGAASKAGRTDVFADMVRVSEAIRILGKFGNLLDGDSVDILNELKGIHDTFKAIPECSTMAPAIKALTACARKWVDETIDAYPEIEEIVVALREAECGLLD